MFLSRANSPSFSLLVDEYMVEDSAQKPSSPPASKIPLPSARQSSNFREQRSSPRSTPVRGESMIVASEVDDADDLSADKLQRTFEMINATADRILDQIDKVGSISSEHYYNDHYEELAGYSEDAEVFHGQQPPCSHPQGNSHFVIRVKSRFGESLLLDRSSFKGINCSTLISTSPHELIDDKPVAS